MHAEVYYYHDARVDVSFADTLCFDDCCNVFIFYFYFDLSKLLKVFLFL